jgi:hypothetical protein
MSTAIELFIKCYPTDKDAKHFPNSNFAIKSISVHEIISMYEAPKGSVPRMENPPPPPPPKDQQQQVSEEIKGFTPGPWVVSPASTKSATWDEIYSFDMETLICSMDMSKQKTIRMTEEGENILEDTDEIDEAIANAKLIASAPTMYAELSKLKEEVLRYRKALEEIGKACDNENPTHEIIWRISYEALNPNI